MSLPGPPANDNRPWQLVLLGLLTLLGCAFRVWQTRESLWLDELHTAWCATGSLAEVAERAAIGNQSPLFFWLEWALVRLLGPSELTLRLPSVLAGSVLPVAIYSLCRRWSLASWIGLLAAALIVFDPLSIFFATEARPYALVQLLATVHIGIAVEHFLRPTAVLRFAFVALAAILFHFHYTAALLLAAESILWALLIRTQPASVRHRWPAFALDLALVAILCLPAVGSLVAIFERRDNWAAFVPSRSLWAPWDLFQLLPWSLGAFFILVALASKARKDLLPGLIALCWFLVPVFLAWLATAGGMARLFFPRYVAVSAPAAILLTAMCADLFPQRWLKVACGASILSFALWTSGIAHQLGTDGRIIGDRREDWRGAIAWLNAELLDDYDPVFVASGLIEADALRAPHSPLFEDYCLFPVTSLYPLAAERRDLVPLPFRVPTRPDEKMRRLIDERNGAWVIFRGRRSSAQSAARSWHGGEIKSFGNVHIFKFTLRPFDP
jgi:hypothetical protein